MANIESLSSLEQEEEVKLLEDIVEQLTSAEAVEEEVIEALVSLLVRFPSDDSYGLFMGIVHIVESWPGYESKVLRGLKECRGETLVLMADRIVRTNGPHSSQLKAFL